MPSVYLKAKISLKVVLQKITQIDSIIVIPRLFTYLLT